MSVTGIVLAGGKSRRMGEDKRFLAVGAATLLERSLAVMRGIFPEVLIVTAQDSPPLEIEGVRVCRDLVPDCARIGETLRARPEWRPAGHPGDRGPAPGRRQPGALGAAACGGRARSGSPRPPQCCRSGSCRSSATPLVTILRGLPEGEVTR